MCLAVPGKVLTITGNDPLLRSGRVSFPRAYSHALRINHIFTV